MPAAALFIFEETTLLVYKYDLFMFANQKALLNDQSKALFFCLQCFESFCPFFVLVCLNNSLKSKEGYSH